MYVAERREMADAISSVSRNDGGLLMITGAITTERPVLRADDDNVACGGDRSKKEPHCRGFF